MKAVNAEKQISVAVKNLNALTIPKKFDANKMSAFRKKALETKQFAESIVVTDIESKLDGMRDAYAPFDPDRDTVTP